LHPSTSRNHLSDIPYKNYIRSLPRKVSGSSGIAVVKSTLPRKFPKIQIESACDIFNQGKKAASGSDSSGHCGR
jgi:hypothetical protein